MQMSLEKFNHNVFTANAMVLQVPDLLSQLKSMFGVWNHIVRPSDAHEQAATSAEPSSAAPAPAANFSCTAEAAARTGLDADPMADEASHSAANDGKMQPAVTDTAAGDDPNAAASPVCTGQESKGSHRQRHMRRPRKSFPPAADELAGMEPVVQPAPAQQMTRAAAAKQAGQMLTSGYPSPNEPVMEPVVQPATAQRGTRAAARQAEAQAGHVLTSGNPAPAETVVTKPVVHPTAAQRMTRAAAKQAEEQAGHVLTSVSPAPDELVVTNPVVQAASAQQMTRAAAKHAEAQAEGSPKSGPPAPDELAVIESAVQPASVQRMTRAAAKQADVQTGHVLRSSEVSASRAVATLALPSGRGSALQTTRAARAAATAQQADRPSQISSATLAAQHGHDDAVQQGTPAPAVLASGVRGRLTRLTLEKSAAVPAAPEAVTSGTPIATRRLSRPAKTAAVSPPDKPEAASVTAGKPAVVSRPGRGRQMTAVPAYADPEAADAMPAAQRRAATAELQGTNVEPDIPATEPFSAGLKSAGARPEAATPDLGAATADPAAEPEAAAPAEAAAQHAHFKQPASAPSTRVQSTACTASKAVRPVRRCCRNRRCKACRAKAEADKQSAPADTPSSQSDAIPDDKAAVTTAAADSIQPAQLEAALTPQQPPEPGRGATPTPADPAANARGVCAASRGDARTERMTPSASDRLRSTTRKRHHEEESDTEQLPMRPMPAKVQQSTAQTGNASQQADKQIAAVAQPAAQLPVDFPTGSASPAESPSDRASLAAQSSDGLSPAGVSSDEPAAAVPQAEWPASAQSPEQLPAPQASETAAALAAAAADRSYCSTKAQGLSQFAAATHVADADADAAAVSLAVVPPGETPARRSARSQKATEKAAAADGSFAALAKGTKLPSDTAHQGSSQQDRPAACSPAGRGTKRAADLGVSDPSAPAALTVSKSVARKKRRQSAGAAGADHRHRKAVNDDDDVETFTEVHTKPETAIYLDGNIDKVSRGVRKTPGGRGSAALPHQSQMASVHSLDVLIAAATEVETGLAPEAEVCH